MSRMEGFGIPGNIPTLRNNPLDLRHSPHSSHPIDDPNGIGWIDTVIHGWEDGDRQLHLYNQESLNMEEVVKVFLGIPSRENINSPNPDNNNGVVYLQFLCDGLRVTAETPLADALKFEYKNVSPVLFNT